MADFVAIDIDGLDPHNSPQANDKLVIRDKTTNRDKSISVATLLGSGTPGSIPDWNKDTIYDTTEGNKYAIEDDRIWRSLQNANQNHRPSSDDPETPVWWVEVSRSVGSAIREWQAGMYEETDVVVKKDGVLYELVAEERPYESVDFVAELAANDWSAFVGAGISDAPVDGNQYARKDAAWEIVEGGGGTGVFEPVQDITALKALNTTTAEDWPDKWVILVEDEGQFYRLDRDSAVTEALPYIVAPTTGVGMWIQDQYAQLQSKQDKVLEQTTFDDSGPIVVDSSKEYNTTRVVSLSTHTLTASGTGNKIGQYNLARYEFEVDCTIDLIGFDLTGSTLGTINPITAGTYNFWFYATPFGISLIIQNNSGSQQTPTLSAPTLTATAGDGEITLVITNEDPAATGRVLLRNTVNDESTATAVSGYDGSANYTDTEPVNGTEYLYFFYNTASGYNNSITVVDSATPAATITQLDAPTITGDTVGEISGQVILTFINPNSGNEDSNLLQYKLSTEPTTWTDGASAATSATEVTQTGLTDGQLYDFRILAIGSGTYSNSAPSATYQATPSDPALNDGLPYFNEAVAYYNVFNEADVTLSGSNVLGILNRANPAKSLSKISGTITWDSVNKLVEMSVNALMTGDDNLITLGDCTLIFVIDNTTIGSKLAFSYPGIDTRRWLEIIYNSSTSLGFAQFRPQGVTTMTWSDSGLAAGFFTDRVIVAVKLNSAITSNNGYALGNTSDAATRTLGGAIEDTNIVPLNRLECRVQATKFRAIVGYDRQLSEAEIKEVMDFFATQNGHDGWPV